MATAQVTTMVDIRRLTVKSTAMRRDTRTVAHTEANIIRRPTNIITKADITSTMAKSWMALTHVLIDRVYVMTENCVTASVRRLHSFCCVKLVFRFARIALLIQRITLLLKKKKTCFWLDLFVFCESLHSLPYLFHERVKPD